uniref:Inner membrane protein n=1 Tax=Ascaris lumbricoides TaxID=6252 RepID=A0A0M3HUH7_ASCLU
MVPVIATAYIENPGFHALRLQLMNTRPNLMLSCALFNCAWLNGAHLLNCVCGSIAMPREDSGMTHLQGVAS